VRGHLHFATGRPEERLSFDLQPQIAKRMGYEDRPRKGGDNTPAVERFMRRYFLIAREGRRADPGNSAPSWRLTAEKTAPKGLSRFLPAPPRRQDPSRWDEPGFLIESGRLTIEGVETFERDPVNLLRLFAIADRRDLDLHPTPSPPPPVRFR